MSSATVDALRAQAGRHEGPAVRLERELDSLRAQLAGMQGAWTADLAGCERRRARRTCKAPGWRQRGAGRAEGSARHSSGGSCTARQRALTQYTGKRAGT